MRESTFFTVAGVTVITGLLAYAFYFDYKRRNDVEFRKKLRMSFLLGVDR
jgi:mitochondrial import receptor subunit TOM20